MQLLKDETLRIAPITAAINYTWTALSASWKNTAIVAMVLVLLSIATLIPLVGLVASLIQGILLYALAYWVVDRLKSSVSIEDFKTKIATESDAKGMMVGFFSPAMGFYVGFMIFSLLMMLITFGIFWLSGGFSAMDVMMQQQAPNVSSQEVTAMYTHLFATSTPALLFMLLSSAFLGYVWPLVYGYALFQRTFGDAFNAIFMLFSPRFWKASFTWAYFKLVSLWMLILLGVGLLTGFAIAIVILLPLGVLMMMWMVYFSAIVAAEAYDMAEDI